jgi:hypothetical protein
MSHEIEVSRKNEWYIIHKVTGSPRKRWRHHQWLHLTREEAWDLMIKLTDRLGEPVKRA